MKDSKKVVMQLSQAELAQISGGFNPIKYGKYVVDEFVKGFRQAW